MNEVIKKNRKVCSILLALILCTCSLYVPSQLVNAETTVYITATGKKYHYSRNCKGLSNAKSVSTTTLSAAKSKGLTACSICANGSSDTGSNNDNNGSSNDDSSIPNYDNSDKIALDFGSTTIEYGKDIIVTLKGENQDWFSRTDLADGTVCYVPYACKLFDVNDNMVLEEFWSAGDFSNKVIKTSTLNPGTYDIGGFVDKYVYHKATGWRMNESEKGSTKGLHTILTIVKKDQNIKVKTITQKIKYSSLKKKSQSIKAAKAFKVVNSQGKVRYTVTKYDKKAKQKIKVSSAGKVTISKGLRKGTYTIMVNITADGNEKYNSASKSAKLKIQVK